MAEILIIKLNPALNAPVLVRDLSYPIPPQPDNVTLTEIEDIRYAQESTDLKRLALDDLFGGTSTIILNDGDADVPLAEVEEFLRKLDDDVTIEDGAQLFDLLIITTQGGLVYNSAGMILIKESP